MDHIECSNPFINGETNYATLRICIFLNSVDLTIEITNKILAYMLGLTYARSNVVKYMSV